MRVVVVAPRRLARILKQHYKNCRAIHGTCQYCDRDRTRFLAVRIRDWHRRRKCLDEVYRPVVRVYDERFLAFGGDYLLCEPLQVVLPRILIYDVLRRLGSFRLFCVLLPTYYGRVCKCRRLVVSSFSQRLIPIPITAIVYGVLVDAARSAVQLGLSAGVVDIRMRKQCLLGDALAARAVRAFNAGPTAFQILFALHLSAFFLTHVKISSG